MTTLREQRETLQEQIDSIEATLGAYKQRLLFFQTEDWQQMVADAKARIGKLEATILSAIREAKVWTDLQTIAGYQGEIRVLDTQVAMRDTVESKIREITERRDALRKRLIDLSRQA